MPTVLTTCPFCACGCGLYLQTWDGKLVGVGPSENHPVSRGKICARGWAAHEASAWGERLVTPLIRHDGELKPSSWPEATALVADRFSTLREQGKAIGVLGSPRATNEENFLAAKLGRVALGAANVDFCLRGAYLPLIDGVTRSLGRLPRPVQLGEIAQSECILLVEGDLASTHPMVACSVMQAVARGARLVTVGNTKTRLGRLAKRRLVSTPESLGEVTNGLLAAAMGSGFVCPDREKECRGGFSPLRAALAPVQPSDRAMEAARWLGEAQRAVFLIPASTAPCEPWSGEAAALASLAIVTGHANRPGSGLLLLFDRSNTRGALDMGVTPQSASGSRSMPVEPGRDPGQPASRAMQRPGPDLGAAAMLDAVSGLLVLADDPPAALPAGNRAREAMEKMEFVVVLDAFATQSTRLADVVLPIAGFAETEGTYTNLEARVQRVRAAVNPPGDAREGWSVLTGLMNAFGCSASFGSAAEVFQEIAKDRPSYSKTSHQALDRGWSQEPVEVPGEPQIEVQASEGIRLTDREYPKLLVLEGGPDWSGDPLVRYSPTLSRDFASRRKLFPAGVVEMARQEADEIGVRQGWKMRIVSRHGEALLPVAIRADLEPGVVRVPSAFREHVEKVTGGEPAAAIRIGAA